jgi:hypothetical protein
MSREELIALANESASEVGCNLTENKYVPTKLALLAQAFLEADAELATFRKAVQPIGEFLESRGNLTGTGDWRVPLTGDELETIRAALKGKS